MWRYWLRSVGSVVTWKLNSRSGVIISFQQNGGFCSTYTMLWMPLLVSDLALNLDLLTSWHCDRTSQSCDPSASGLPSHTQSGQSVWRCFRAPGTLCSRAHCWEVATLQPQLNRGAGRTVDREGTLWDGGIQPLHFIPEPIGPLGAPAIILTSPMYLTEGW